MKLAKQSPDVYCAVGPISSIGEEEVTFLVSAVQASARGRVRINAHPDGDDSLHEMFIAIAPSSYIRPHKHPGKSEAFHLVQGTVDIVVLEDDGCIRDVIRLGARDQGRPFYYRMSKPFFHTLLIRSDILVVHEITNGPFQKGETVFAPFAPDEADALAVSRFQAELGERVAAFTTARR